MMLMNSRAKPKERRDEQERRDTREHREERNYQAMNYPDPYRQRYGGGQEDYYPVPENRFRDRRGREHYDNGRFAPSRNEGGAGEYGSRYYPGPYYPPIYREKDERGQQMNKIGFSVEGEMERLPDEYRNQEYTTERYEDEGIDRHSRPQMERRAGKGESEPVSRQQAERWTEAMENEDGSQGPHWSMEQTKQVQAQQDINCDPIEFYVAMNMMYSDYMKVAKKLGVNKIDFYACMAKAFLDDKDVSPGKLRRYFDSVVNA